MEIDETFEVGNANLIVEEEQTISVNVDDVEEVEPENVHVYLLAMLEMLGVVT